MWKDRYKQCAVILDLLKADGGEIGAMKEADMEMENMGVAR